MNTNFHSPLTDVKPPRKKKTLPGNVIVVYMARDHKDFGFCKKTGPIKSRLSGSTPSYGSCVLHRAPTHSPISLRVAKTVKNHLNEEITPLLSTGIGERFRQNISNLGHAALLRRCELPL